jgi:hypothetical protein
LLKVPVGLKIINNWTHALKKASRQSKKKRRRGNARVMC